MIRVDEYGWVREFDRTPTQPEIEAIDRRLDQAEVTVLFSHHQTDAAYGRNDFRLSPAGNLPTRVARAAEWGMVPDEEIKDVDTAPINFNDPTVEREVSEEVDLEGVDK